MTIIQKHLKFYGKITDFTADNSISLSFKKMVSLKYLNDFWRNIEMYLFKCNINIPTLTKYLRIILVFMK